MAVASAGPYANLHLDPDTTMPASHHFFPSRMFFLPPNQQCQSAEGIALKANIKTYFIWGKINVLTYFIL